MEIGNATTHLHSTRPPLTKKLSKTSLKLGILSKFACAGQYWWLVALPISHLNLLDDNRIAFKIFAPILCTFSKLKLMIHQIKPSPAYDTRSDRTAISWQKRTKNKNPRCRWNFLPCSVLKCILAFFLTFSSSNRYFPNPTQDLVIAHNFHAPIHSYPTFNRI